MLWDTMTSYLKSWFSYPDLETHLMLIGIGLAIVFAVIWLLGYKPPLFKKPGLWGVAIFAAFFTVLAATFVETPLRYYYIQAMEHFWSQNTLFDWLLLTYIPMVLIMGLVQEGAKMVPIVFWWWRSGKRIDPKMGLIIGALAGAGWGIFEAVYAHNQVFMAGWTWDAVSSGGIQALLPFWEQFWMVAGHIAISALAGYGLAKGKGWQFYLLASALHSILLYTQVLYAREMLTPNQMEIVLAVIAALIMLAALWLRWRKSNGEAPITPAEIPVPGEPEKPAVVDV